jgi:hypothetical protein
VSFAGVFTRYQGLIALVLGVSILISGIFLYVAGDQDYFILNLVVSMAFFALYFLRR